MTPDVARQVTVSDSDYCCICGYNAGPVVSFERFGMYPTRVGLCGQCLTGCLEKLDQEVGNDPDVRNDL